MPRRRTRQRSPLHRAAEIKGSVLLLQGADDPVVPPEQAQTLPDALGRRGTSAARPRLFAGESHGFRRAETLKAVFEAALGLLPRGPAGGARRGGLKAETP